MRETVAKHVNDRMILIKFIMAFAPFGTVQAVSLDFPATSNHPPCGRRNFWEI